MSLENEPIKPIAVSYTLEYRREKNAIFYQQAKENGTYKKYLSKKNEKYKSDPEFKAKIKQYNKERYQIKKAQMAELQAQLASLQQQLSN